MATEADYTEVERLSEAAVDKAIAQHEREAREDAADQQYEASRGRRPFTITKFSRHPDGFYHARVTPAGGVAIYVFDKFGSWMAPGEIDGKAVLKEVLPHVAAELAALRRKDVKRLRKEAEDGQPDGSSGVDADDEDADAGEDVG